MDDIFLKPEEILEIDLHEMTVAEARYYLEKELDTAPEYIKVVEVVHGFHKGRAILNMVRKEFKHPRIKRKYLSFNSGITRFELNEIEKTNLEKK
jgi:DNA-nicking Smr family endonuclease